MNTITSNDNFVALLGTKGGPAIRPGSANPTCSLLVFKGRKIIIDCGLGVTRGLVDQGMELDEIGLIFITHLHSDHYLDLGALLHTAWTAGLKSPVTIIGPEGIEKYWQNFLLAMEADIDLRIEDEGRPDLKNMVSIKVLDEGEVYRDKELVVTAMRNEHPPLIDTFALRFSNGEYDVVFSGDTTYLPKLSDFSRGADLLVHEAMLGEALDALFKRIGNADERLMTHFLASHTMAPDAGKTASQANVKALALNHLIPADDPNYTLEDWANAIEPHWTGKLYVGHDGMRINL